MRYMVTAPGKAIGRLLGLPKESGSFRALVLASSFFCSGITHMGLVPPEPAFARPGTSPNYLRLRIAAFFWIQPVGIMLEMGLEYLVGKLQKYLISHDKEKVKLEETIEGTAIEKFGKFLVRGVRFVWVISWLCLTVRFATVPFAELGFWNLPTLWVVPRPFRYYFSGVWLP